MATGTSVVDTILDKVLEFLGTLVFTIAIFVLMLVFTPKFAENSLNYVGKENSYIFRNWNIRIIALVLISIILLFSYIGTLLSTAIITFTFINSIAISFSITATCIPYKLKEKFKLSTKIYEICLYYLLLLLLSAFGD